MHRAALVVLFATSLMGRAHANDLANTGAGGGDVITNAPTIEDIQKGTPAKPPLYSNEPPTSPTVTPKTETPDKPSDDGDQAVSPTKAKSPDKRYVAAINDEDDPVVIWHPKLKRGVLVVAKMPETYDLDDEPKSVPSYVRYDFPRFGAQLGWSPDSKYIVITTTDRNGVAPWHWTAIVYSVKTKTLRCLDPVSGDVIASDFKFTGPHTVQLKVAPDDRDFSKPIVVEVDLNAQFAAMPKVGIRTEGTNAQVLPNP